MKVEDLKKAKFRQPFEPFLILLADGREIPVGNTEVIAWDHKPPHSAVCCLPDGRKEWFEIPQIVSLRFPARETTSRSVIDRIRDAKAARPFVPFRIKLADGTDCFVEGPDFVSIPPVKRPREVLFYSARPAPDSYSTRWINATEILDVIASDEPRPATPESAEDDEA